jgi:hypothetical protein
VFLDPVGQDSMARRFRTKLCEFGNNLSTALRFTGFARLRKTSDAS